MDRMYLIWNFQSIKILDIEVNNKKNEIMKPIEPHLK